MYTLEEMEKLSNEDFYKAFINGELNSMDLTAREYFERKDFIAEQITKREVLKEVGEHGAYVYGYVRGEDMTDEYMVPRYALGIAKDEGAAIILTFVESEEERERIIDMFENTGRLQYHNYPANKAVDEEVNALLEVDVKKIYVSKEFVTEFDKDS